MPECESDPPQFETNGWGHWALPDSRGRCERFVPVGATCAADSFHPTDTKHCSRWVYEHHDTIVSTVRITTSNAVFKQKCLQNTYKQASLMDYIDIQYNNLIMCRW